MTSRKKSHENILRKGDDAGKQHFLLFPKCFLPQSNTEITPGATFGFVHVFCKWLPFDEVVHFTI